MINYWHPDYCERCGWELADYDDGMCCVCQATVEKQEEEDE